MCYAEWQISVEDETGTRLPRYAHDSFGRPIIETTAPDTIGLPQCKMGLLAAELNAMPAEVLTLA